MADSTDRIVIHPAVRSGKPVVRAVLTFAAERERRLFTAA